MKNFFRYLHSHLPLVLVIIIALTVAFVNIDPQTYYSGWDNIHAEFDLGRYAKQVFFGAWLDRQALGAPAGQGHLSEIPRLPILFFLKLVLPDNLVRYVYIFSMYLIGGLGCYLFLSRIWLSQRLKKFKPWLASLGAVFYLLHLLTMQQFYISFEMFMAHFAFLPFLLLLVHRLDKRFNARSILLFIGLQLLIAPSGHTSTVFYLGTLFSLIYAFFVHLPKGLLQAVKFSFLIGLMTLAANAYWILPNVYYSLAHSDYVSDSRDNQMFAPESLWSIREAANLSSLTSGAHYLFSWKDYSIGSRQFEYIFAEWSRYLAQPLPKILMHTLGAITLIGWFVTAANKKQGSKRAGIVLTYLACVALIYIDILPTYSVVLNLFKFSPFFEAFRNPFTKLSMIYALVSILLFIQVYEGVVMWLKTKRWRFVSGSWVASLLLGLTLGAIICVAWPTFQGRFISEKLKIKYPSEYQQLFEFMKTKDKDLRVLQLPQLSHAGWVYHDWTFIEPGNGYQGMSFTFFGLNQPVMVRDFDRWGETSDFFYHELKYALDCNDAPHFKQLLAKYNLDIVIIDETKFSPSREHDYRRDHNLITAAGLTKIWQQNFLTVYERLNPIEAQTEQLLVPATISLVTAETDRVVKDYVYQQEQDYLLVSSEEASLFYPFNYLLHKQLDMGVTFAPNLTTLTAEVVSGEYELTLPGITALTYFTPIELSYQGEVVTVTFPQYTLVAGEQRVSLPQLLDFQFTVETPSPSLIVFFNEQGIIINQGEIAQPVLALSVDQPLSIKHLPKTEYTRFDTAGNLSFVAGKLIEALLIEPDWTAFKQPVELQTGLIDHLNFISQFPVMNLDLQQNPSVNCSSPQRGVISTRMVEGETIYQASDHAVNCNGYTFNFASPAYSYLLHLVGDHTQGRGTKFFLNFADEAIIPEDYLMPEVSFDTILSWPQLSADPSDRFFLNWETRSFGQKSINQLSQLELSAVPLTTLAQLKLTKIEASSQIENSLTIHHQWSKFNFLHWADYSCEADKCYLELDQSYDDWWLAFAVRKKLAGETLTSPHYRLNNWANAWQVVGSGQLLIVYVPQLISLVSLFSLLAVTAWLGFRAYHSRQK